MQSCEESYCFLFKPLGSNKHYGYRRAKFSIKLRSLDAIDICGQQCNVCAGARVKRNFYLRSVESERLGEWESSSIKAETKVAATSSPASMKVQARTRAEKSQTGTQHKVLEITTCQDVMYVVRGGHSSFCPSAMFWTFILEFKIVDLVGPWCIALNCVGKLGDTLICSVCLDREWGTMVLGGRGALA